jgi:hypothetical protein
MSIKWRIYCITDNKWEYIWNNSSPTVCPIDANHTVNDNSISDVSKLQLYSNIHILKPISGSNIYTKIASFISPNNIISFKMMSYMDGDAISYDCKIINQNNVIIKTLTFNNTTLGINIIDSFDNEINTDDILEFYIKSDNSKKIYVESISSYYEE